MEKLNKLQLFSTSFFSSRGSSTSSQLPEHLFAALRAAAAPKNKPRATLTGAGVTAARF